MILTHPQRKPGVEARKLGLEWLLYDGETGSVHILNETAIRVWEMCDGTHTVREMAAALSAAYEMPEADVKVDLDQVLRSFVAKGIVMSVAE